MMRAWIFLSAIMGVVATAGIAEAEGDLAPILSVSGLTLVQGPLTLNGMPVNDQHPLMGSPGFEKVLEAASRFDQAADCLEENDNQTIAAGAIDDEYDLNVCIQRIATVAADPAAFANWLRVAGFKFVSNEVASRGTLTFEGIQISPSGQVVGASWRDRAGGPDFTYPLSRSFNLANLLSIRNLSVSVTFDENNDIVHSRVSIIRL